MAIQKGGWRKFWHYARLPVVILLIVWGGFVLVEVKLPVSKARSDATVAAIHAQRLTMADVDGSNLPPEPDPKKNNATVAGIDANENGIRDDVELAIFKQYPNNQKDRAGDLQYALSLQLRLTKIVDEKTWQASVYEKSRAYFCIASIVNRGDAVERLKKTQERAQAVELLVMNNSTRRERDERQERFSTAADLAESDYCDLRL